MSEIAYPLTGKPFAFATLITDAGEERAEEERRGARLPEHVEAALRSLVAKAEADDAAKRPTGWGDHLDEMLPGYDPEARAATRRDEETIRTELGRLVAVRVNASEAAKMADRERSAIVRLIKDGILYAEREGRDWRIPVYALDALPPKSNVGRPRKPIA